jgi:hypothetical protein
MTTTPPTDDNHDNNGDKRGGGSSSTGTRDSGDHPRGGRNIPHGTDPTSGESYNSLSRKLAGPVNTAELTLVAFLTTITAAARLSAAQAIRRRGPREAVCYAHAADLAVRMPDLFDRMRTDTRYSVEHLDIIWIRINRHARALAAAGEQLPATVDETVATRLGVQITPDGMVWSVPALGDVTDGILADVAPAPVADTEETERRTVGLRRRGTRFTLECGDRSVADGLWEPLSTAALEVRKEILAEQETLRAQQQREARASGEPESDPESEELAAARRIVDNIINPAGASDESGVPEERAVATLAAPLPAPGMVRCRGEAMLKILGGHRDQLKVVVNVYTPRTGEDPAGPDNPGSGPDGGDAGPAGPDGDGGGPAAPDGRTDGDDVAPAAPDTRGTAPTSTTGSTGSTGATCGPGFVIGTGWVSPTTTATLIDTADLVRDLPDISSLTDTTCYRFTTLHRATAVGRDARCRFPGCQVPADRCELDHIINSPFTDPSSDGPTSIRNCACLCRTHHQLKTKKLWKVHTPDDGITLHWTGPAGVTATTVASGPLIIGCATGTDPGGPAAVA